MVCRQHDLYGQFPVHLPLDQIPETCISPGACDLQTAQAHIILQQICHKPVAEAVCMATCNVDSQKGPTMAGTVHRALEVRL